MSNREGGVWSCILSSSIISQTDRSWLNCSVSIYTLLVCWTMMWVGFIIIHHCLGYVTRRLTLACLNGVRARVSAAPPVKCCNVWSNIINLSHREQNKYVIKSVCPSVYVSHQLLIRLKEKSRDVRDCECAVFNLLNLSSCSRTHPSFLCCGIEIHILSLWAFVPFLFVAVSCFFVLASHLFVVVSHLCFSNFCALACY